jgi:ABC-type nitrate/sulfonate/bicarbonate transport system substrate-binding protein
LRLIANHLRLHLAAKRWARKIVGKLLLAHAAGDPTFTAIARKKGQKAVVVGTVVAGATYWGVTWKDIPPTKSAAGLKDLRIATYEAPSTNYALMAKTL